jgi:hypothetical protein
MSFLGFSGGFWIRNNKRECVVVGISIFDNDDKIK